MTQNRTEKTESEVREFTINLPWHFNTDDWNRTS